MKMDGVHVKPNEYLQALQTFENAKVATSLIYTLRAKYSASKKTKL